MVQTVTMHTKHWYFTPIFIRSAATTAFVFGLFVLWQLGFFRSIVYSLPRGNPSWYEYVFATALIIMVSANVGLLRWQKHFGHCPVGNKRASGIASILGAFALVCPACVVVPFTLFGSSIILSTFSPYIPMIQIVSLVLLGISIVLLIPKQDRAR